MTQGRQHGEAATLGRAELALAYELRNEGYRWRLIARALGATEHYLRQRLKQCEREGVAWIKDI